MHLIDPATLENAVKRAFESRRLFVRRTGRDAFEVLCDNPECALGGVHPVRFELLEGDLYGHCEECPSNVGGHPCRHIAAALALRHGLADVERHALRSQARADRDGRVETAVRLDGPLDMAELPAGPAEPAAARRERLRRFPPAKFQGRGRGAGFTEETAVLADCAKRATRVGPFVI